MTAAEKSRADNDRSATSGEIPGRRRFRRIAAVCDSRAKNLGLAHALLIEAACLIAADTARACGNFPGAV
jgi:hypothetical protein